MRAGLAALCLAVLPACNSGAGSEPPPPPAERRELGLFTSLPILWAETADMGAMIRGEGERSWAGEALETRYVLKPLDTLDTDTLAGMKRVVLAQPRPLAPSENVALDVWVREGGRVLIFADPVLTRHSLFSLGDKRRPQDVILLSPILNRWGLALGFDESQQEGERTVPLGDASVPVNLAGSLSLDETDAPARCAIAADGLVAQCRIGKGRATVVADAALFDWEGPEPAPRARHKALESLVQAALLD